MTRKREIYAAHIAASKNPECGLTLQQSECFPMFSPAAALKTTWSGSGLETGEVIRVNTLLLFHFCASNLNTVALSFAHIFSQMLTLHSVTGTPFSNPFHLRTNVHHAGDYIAL